MSRNASGPLLQAQTHRNPGARLIHRSKLRRTIALSSTKAIEMVEGSALDSAARMGFNSSSEIFTRYRQNCYMARGKSQ